MCGLVALYSPQNNLPSNEKINATLATLKHRGPDEQSFFSSEFEKVMLGHTRLSIIGLETGLQPLFNQDKSIVAVVNGEFYDYQKIRLELEGLGCHFQTDTDSEIILHLYEKYGLESLKKLNGEFAFILWDKRQGKMIAVRDRFGAKPLYFSLFQGSLYLASEIKALFKLGVPSEIDHEGIAGFLFGIPSQSKTSFKYVSQIKPGHYVVFDGRDFLQKCYWDFDFSPEKLENIDPQMAVKHFKEKLSQAVERRMIADVPVGCYLSGGIDSSAVLAFAARANPSVQGFNIAFDDEDYNENKYAALVSNFLKVKLHTLKVTQDDLAANYQAAIYHREAPVYQTSGIAKFLLSKFTNSLGFKAVLTGEGADEVLCGYPSFREDYLSSCSEEERNALFLKLKQENSNVSAAYVSAGDYSELSAFLSSLGYIPSFLKLSLDIGHTMQGVLSNDFRAEITPANLILQTINAYAPPKNWEVVNKSQYLWSKTFFPELILSYLGDRMEMAHSIEGRLPFLDLDLINFLSTLPNVMKINESLVDKFILRESLKGMIPEEIRLRQKHIFAAPSALRRIQVDRNSPIKTLMQDAFSSRSFAELGLFSSEKLLTLLSKTEYSSPRDMMISEFSLNLALSTYFLVSSKLAVAI